MFYCFTDSDCRITTFTPKKDSVPVLSVIEEALHSVKPIARSTSLRSGNYEYVSTMLCYIDIA